MNVNDITFGIEIETTIPATAGIRVGGHGAGIEVPGLPGWLADRDPSIRVGVQGHVPCEFVSPVFKGIEGLKQCLAAVAAIKAMGAKVNESCGLHIHVGFDKSHVANSKRLATLVANFEKAIFAVTGTKSRERGRWCAGLNQHGDVNRAIDSSRRNRYHVCNFGTVKPTVEFRAFGASLSVIKIAAYVKMCVAIVERALTVKKVTAWTAKVPVATSPIHRSGEGHTAVTRLFYQLGWIKGRVAHVHGDLSGEGLPTMDECKKEMVRLAKKYDAMA